MNKNLIKELIIEYQGFAQQISLVPRKLDIESNCNYVFVGLRHAGKSYTMFQCLQQLIASGHKSEEMLYFNFEDDRLENLQASDLDLIKTCYEELYDYRPIFFLDEIQIVSGWEKFARRLADQKFKVFITGSNAKMLSAEIATTLGGRYLIHEVYPYSFEEFLTASGLSPSERNFRIKNRKQIDKLFEQYFTYGALPELPSIQDKRSWLSSLFNKIFFGDLVTRHQIRNNFALKILVKKLAESLKQPVSYNRIANIVSTVGKKLSVDACIDYIKYMQESWLILPYENYQAKLQEKESNRKYYFIDNGILALFLMDPQTSLLENVVAIELRKRYGNSCFFYNANGYEVDFYIPDEGIAIQACYALDKPETYERELNALVKFAKAFSVKKLLIITKDESKTLEKDGFEIECISVANWLLG
ncbi:MAG: ATP-binding protein [Fibrobacter sp.]|nr:ATP-binding protein [Fibrobacter sp.]